MSSGEIDPGELSLRLRQRDEADPNRGGVPIEYYDMIVAGNIVGTLQFRLGDTDDIRLYAGHVGYGVRPQYRGCGYGSLALAALRPIALKRGFQEIWVTCQADNVASCRTLEKAGATFEGTVTVPLNTALHARGLLMRRYRLTLADMP